MSAPQLDLVFCCDCTGSMGGYISSVKENIIKISEEILATESRDLRYGLVCYRDHPPQESTYITKVFDFTPDIHEMKKNVNTMEACGGGDGPEAVTAGMKQVLDLNYREDAVKICILIADAPPHGIGEGYDGFPDGAPDGDDPLVIARQMKDKRILLYSVWCGGMSGNSGAFFQAVSDITTGKFISLTDALLLPKVIVGGAEEEIAMEKLSIEVENERRALKMSNPDMEDGEIIRIVTQKLAAANRQVNKLLVDKQITAENADCFINSESLKEAREKLKSRPTSTPVFSFAARPTPLFSSPLSKSAVKKTKAGKKKKGSRGTMEGADADADADADAAPSTPPPASPKPSPKKAGDSTPSPKKPRSAPTTPAANAPANPSLPKTTEYYTKIGTNGEPLRRSGRILSHLVQTGYISPNVASVLENRVVRHTRQGSVVVSPNVPKTFAAGVKSETPRAERVSKAKTPKKEKDEEGAKRARSRSKSPKRDKTSASSPKPAEPTASPTKSPRAGQSAKISTEVVTDETIAKIYERNRTRFGKD